MTPTTPTTAATAATEHCLTVTRRLADTAGLMADVGSSSTVHVMRFMTTGRHTRYASNLGMSCVPAFL